MFELISSSGCDRGIQNRSRYAGKTVRLGKKTTKRQKGFQFLIRCGVPIIFSMLALPVAYATQIDLYIACDQKIQVPDGVHIHRVLCDKMLDKQTNLKLKGLTKSQAIAKLKQLAQSPQFQKQYRQAFDQNIAAQSHGIHRVPAVVFNQQYVVYGTTNIRQAKHAYDQYQEKRYETD